MICLRELNLTYLILEDNKFIIKFLLIDFDYSVNLFKIWTADGLLIINSFQISDCYIIFIEGLIVVRCWFNRLNAS